MTRVRRWAAAVLAALAAAATLIATAVPGQAAAGAPADVQPRPSAGPTSNVVGGTPGDVVYFAMIGAKGFCGGTAIGGDWILTAAHCVVGFRAPVYLCPACAGVTPDQVVAHPLWDGNSEHGHDLALLRLPAGTVRGAIIPRVGAPWDPGAYDPGTQAEIMGYGVTCSSCPTSSVLLTANTELLSDSFMNSYFYANWAGSLMIGAGSSVSGACFGDSGGPLVVHRNGVAVQVGVVSFGRGSCDLPSGFMELSGPQLAWVAGNVPQVAANWGTCTAPDGLAGVTYVHYDTTAVNGDQGSDGPYHWQIGCHIIGVPVPNVRGLDETSARNAITGSGLAVGSVSHNNDCVDPNNVESQSPIGGATARRGSAVNFTVSTCVTTGGGGGDTGGGGSGGGDGPPTQPR